MSSVGDKLYTAYTTLQTVTLRASNSNESNSCECVYIRWTRCCSHNSFHTSLASEIARWIYSMEGKINILQPGISGAIQFSRWGSTNCVNTIRKTWYSGAFLCLVIISGTWMYIYMWMSLHTYACNCLGNGEHPQNSHMLLFPHSSSSLTQWFEWSKSSLCVGKRLMARLNGLPTHSI